MRLVTFFVYVSLRLLVMELFTSSLSRWSLAMTLSDYIFRVPVISHGVGHFTFTHIAVASRQSWPRSHHSCSGTHWTRKKVNRQLPPWPHQGVAVLHLFYLTLQFSFYHLNRDGVRLCLRLISSCVIICYLTYRMGRLEHARHVLSITPSSFEKWSRSLNLNPIEKSSKLTTQRQTRRIFMRVYVQYR